MKEDSPIAAGEASAEEAACQDEPGSPLLISGGWSHAVAHEGMGDALVYRREDGSHAPRLEKLDIFNGPALNVYAAAAPDTDDADTVLNARFVNAGRLKANQGNQTYELPTIYRPWESGTDNSPRWSDALKRVPVITAALSLWLCICLLLPNRQRVPLTRCSQPGSETLCWSPVILSGRRMSFWKRLFPSPCSPTLIAKAAHHVTGIRVRDLPIALGKRLR